MRKKADQHFNLKNRNDAPLDMSGEPIFRNEQNYLQNEIENKNISQSQHQLEKGQTTALPNEHKLQMLFEETMPY